MNKDDIFALYARVSSDKQAKDKTIDSQIAALKEKIAADGGTLIEDMMFIDAGVSGATLVRPELERLRDSTAVGAVDRVYLLSPDRLARKYAHQALLLEEFSSAGVAVHFLNHAVGTTPEEELLLQMQGMIAEYERAKIIERHRRGKLHRAKGGSVNVLSTAPYGYTYIRKQLDGEPAQYIINLQQAKTVRQVFRWIGVERLSIGEVCRRLSEAEIHTQTGKPHWDRSVIWGMLQNPAYMGRAAFGKTKAGKLKPRVRPQKHSAETPKKPYSTQRTDRDTWIEIPVPPLVSEELFQAVQHQLDENRKRARIGSRGACYLLQGLTVCGHCHYAYYGKKISPSTAKGKRQYAYYRCIGTDAYRFGGERICDNKQVRTQRLDDVVWGQVLDAIKNPKRLKKEYENRPTKMEGDARELFDTTALRKQKVQLEKGKSRLIDSYASAIIDKGDFEPKIKNLKIKLAQIDEQIEQSIKTEGAQHELFLVINRLEEFAKKVNVTLDAVDFNTKREIIRALVKRVEIYKEEVVVVFRIDPEAPANDAASCTSPSETGGAIMHSCNRRTLTTPVEYYADDFVIIVKGNKAHAEVIREECRAFLEGTLRLTLNMDKTHITHVNDGFTFLGHRIIGKRGPRGTMRPVTTIPRDKFRNFAHKLVDELSGNYSVNKIDLVERLNRQLAGWANFYQFTDYTAVMYGKLDRIIFWKLAHWLARKYRTSIKSLMRQWVRRPADGKAKIWQLFGRSGRGNLCGVTLRRLVTSRKSQFRWRNPEINPYITRDEVRNTVTSRYHDVAMAMSQP